MKTLLMDGREEARFAVRLFCQLVAQSVCSMATLLGELDALALSFLGFALDEGARQENVLLISTAQSLPVLIIPANEEDLMREVSMPLFSPPR